MKWIYILGFLLWANTSFAQPTLVHPTNPNPCGMVLNTSPVIFCYTFDAPSTNGGPREGALDGDVWGASRGIGQAINSGQGFFNQWNVTAFAACDNTTPNVLAPSDIQICNGQLREASNDNNTLQPEAGDVTVLAMYPKQPFDFTGRTGTISFDISNDTANIHAAWPEIWISDLPVPMPFNHFDTWQAMPQNAVGIRFAGEAPIGQIGTCNTGPTNVLRWTMDSNSVSRNYTLDDTFTCMNGQTAGCGFRPPGGSNMSINILGCVLMGTGPRTGPQQMNHVEIRISQNQADIYATDAGVKATPATLKHIAVINNLNLGLTTGLVWMEDVHYNADKGDAARPSQRQHTFTWDNLAFDGPFTHRDFTYDAPDNNASGPNGAHQLGRGANANQLTTWTITGVPAVRNQAKTVILFNFSYGFDSPPPTSLTVVVNGNSHNVPWPYPDDGIHSPQVPGDFLGAWRTLAVVVPNSDLVTGTNTVQIGGTVTMAVANVDIALANVPGGVPILPGSNNKYPGT